MDPPGHNQNIRRFCEANQGSRSSLCQSDAPGLTVKEDKSYFRQIGAMKTVYLLFTEKHLHSKSFKSFFYVFLQNSFVVRTTKQK